MLRLKKLESLVWESSDNKSREEFALFQSHDRFILRGTVTVRKTLSLISYEVRCDKYWQTRSVYINQESGTGTSHLDLSVDQDGVWCNTGFVVPWATDLLDVDFEFSPSTNTLTINRLNLKIGESKEVTTLWVRLESLSLWRLRQKYERIGTYHYRYEGLSFPYKAVLEVDKLGLIVNYGNLWQRVAK